MSGSKRDSREVGVAEAAALACPERPLLDIRDADERSAGVPSGAIPVAPGDLLERCRNLAGGYLICAEGVRSLAAVQRLQAAGLGGFRSVAGGFQAWQQARLPSGYPDGFEAAQAERYARHLVMPQVGVEGQRRLRATRMLLVGLGGLNSPAALYLAAAGVGRLGLVDDDRVERSNLQRQVIHGESSLGANKGRSAAERLRDLNPDTETVVIEQRVDADNAAALVADWDIVLDGTDNFAARYALNAACVRAGKPLVYGAVMRFQGQLSVFWPAAPLGPAPCLRCLLPQSPAPEDAPACAEAGVLGVMPGIIGTLQAGEALKLALGIGRPLVGRLLMIDALGMEFREARIAADPRCPVCAATLSRS
jgi:molybdopterin/thiamine biosynthesis adenylyltransferase/rhodanese-related sulfurtransferase